MNTYICLFMYYLLDFENMIMFFMNCLLLLTYNDIFVLSLDVLLILQLYGALSQHSNLVMYVLV